MLQTIKEILVKLEPPPYLPPLVFSVKTQTSRARDPDAEEADAELREIKPRIHLRDGNACQYCGIRVGPTKQESEGKDGGKAGFTVRLHVHHLDDKHGNNDPKNLISICPLCHAVLHIGKNAKSRGLNSAMLLVWLPWIKQQDLNLLCWAMAIAHYKLHNSSNERKDNKDDAQAKARQKIMESLAEIDIKLKNAGVIPQNAFAAKEENNNADLSLILGKANGEGADELAGVLAHIQRAKPLVYENREKILGGLRLYYEYDRLDTVWESENPGITPWKIKDYASMQAWHPEPWIGLWDQIWRGQNGRINTGK